MILIKKEPNTLWDVKENCCFCRKETSFWTHSSIRSSYDQVACCKKCSIQFNEKDVPSKEEWCAKEWAIEDENKNIP
jgi:hypothetical protein